MVVEEVIKVVFFLEHSKADLLKRILKYFGDMPYCILTE